MLAGEGWSVVRCFRCARSCAAAALGILVARRGLAGGEGGSAVMGFVVCEGDVRLELCLCVEQCSH